ncbi:MAG: FlgD immunoglobulin-like domain containing protein [candidate division FCPU426 bacterium]
MANRRRSTSAWIFMARGALAAICLAGWLTVAGAESAPAGTTPQASAQPALSSSPAPKTAARKQVPRKSAEKKNPSPDQLQKRSWDFQHVKAAQISKNWKSHSGEWVVGPEPEHPGNQVLRQKTVKRNYQMLLSQKTYANFEFSARLRTDSYEQKTSNWQMGLIFRMADNRHYYKFRITAANVALLRCMPQPATVIPDAAGVTPVVSATGRSGKQDEQIVLILPFTGKTDTWYTLSAAGYGERLVLKLDGRELRMLQDSGIGCGRIGVFTYKTRAMADDFRLFYYPAPSLDSGIQVIRKNFSPRQDREVMIYFVNPSAGELQVQVLDAKGKTFQLLTRGPHSPGLNSVTWDAQGLLGEFAKPGLYTIQLTVGDKKYRDTVRVK